MNRTPETCMYTNIYVTGILKERREREGAENKLEGAVVKNFPPLMKTTKMHPRGSIN